MENMENAARKKVMLSGIQPSGDLTLGSYLGAIKNWAERDEEFDNYYFMADMHSITVRQDPAALYVISSILGLSAVMLTSSGAIKAMLFLMALAVAAFLASRVIFHRDIDKALQAEKAAAEEKSTETATPAETVPAEPEEESNEKKKEEA